MNTITFAVEGGDSLHTLSLGAALSGFVSFDLGPFYDKCLAFSENALKTRAYDEADALLIKDLLRGCHPFVTACYNSVFDKIVLDCVIDIICHRENLGLEALWAENISADDPLGSLLFSRISEYKACHAVNQWASLQRMQSYARKKTGYVFAQRDTSLSDCQVRAMYFDLAFITAAKKSGAGLSGLKTAGISSPALLPGAAMLISPVTAVLEPVVSALIRVPAGGLPHFKGECYDEQVSGMLCADLSELPLPDGLEMVGMTEKLRRLPRRVYSVSTFKQIIDLEIEELLSRSLMLWPSGETGRLELLSIEPPPEKAEPYAAFPAEAPEASASTAPSVSEKRSKKSFQKTEASVESGKPPKEKPPKPKKSKTVKEKSPEPETPRPKPAEKEAAAADAAKTPEQKAKEPEKPKASKKKPPSAESPAPDPGAKPEAEGKAVPAPPKHEPSKPEKISEAPSSPSADAAPPVEAHAIFTKPDNVEERMRLLQDLAADRRGPVGNVYKNGDVDVLCQSVHTALKSVLKDERDLQEVDIWAKHLFRIRGGMMAKRFSKDYLLRFLDATVRLYKLEPPILKK